MRYRALLKIRRKDAIVRIMEKNIAVIGDTHGDWCKLASLILYHKPDMVFVAGDFGWWSGWGAEPDTAFPSSVFGDVEIRFVDGNHENHADLVRFAPRGTFDVVKIADRVWYHPRGSVWTLPDGRTLFAAGGAHSDDRRGRKEGKNVFCRLEELQRNNLPDVIPHADVVISHAQPHRFAGCDIRKPDPSKAVLDEVLEAAKPSLWLSGHLHKRIDGNAGDTEWHVLDMLDSGCQGLSEDHLFWLSGQSRALSDVPGWGFPDCVLPVRGVGAYRYAVMNDLSPDFYAVFDKRRHHYRTRRDGGIKGIVPEAVDSFMATLCATGWDLEAAAKRRKD